MVGALSRQMDSAIEAPEALARVCATLGCSEDEACDFLTVTTRKGALGLNYPNGEPEPRLWLIQFPNTDRGGDEIARRLDWRTGKDIRTFKLYPEIPPTREEAMQSLFTALDIKYGLTAPVQREPKTGEDADAAEGQVEIAYPFQVADREQVDAALIAAGAAASSAGLPADRVSFSQAMQVLAPLMGRHYPELEARRALVKGAADERLTGYGRPDRALHYEALQAPLWGWCEITPDGHGNYDLRCNHNGLMSASCDIHFSRADVERFRDYLIATRAMADQIAPTHDREPKRQTGKPGAPSAASPEHASMAVQVMREAYARLIREHKISTSTTIKERYRLVMASAEVAAHIRQAGKDRGCSDDNFNRTVVNADWPEKPQVPTADPQS